MSIDLSIRESVPYLTREVPIARGTPFQTICGVRCVQPTCLVGRVDELDQPDSHMPQPKGDLGAASQIGSPGSADAHGNTVPPFPRIGGERTRRHGLTAKICLAAKGASRHDDLVRLGIRRCRLQQHHRSQGNQHAAPARRKRSDVRLIQRRSPGISRPVPSSLRSCPLPTICAPQPLHMDRKTARSCHALPRLRLRLPRAMKESEQLSMAHLA